MIYRFLLCFLFIFTGAKASDYDACYEATYDASKVRDLMGALAGKSQLEPDEHELACQCSYVLGDYQAAYAYAQYGIEQHGNLFFLHQCGGMALYRLGELEEALSNFDFAIRNDLGDHQSVIYLSKILWDQGRQKESESTLRGYLDYLSSVMPAPLPEVSRYSLAEVELYIALHGMLLSAGRYVEAKDLLDEALSRNNLSTELKELVSD